MYMTCGLASNTPPRKEEPLHQDREFMMGEGNGVGSVIMFTIHSLFVALSPS